MPHAHFNPRERMSLFYLYQGGLSTREIGRKLNRSHSILSRELNRNQRRLGCYCDHAAQKMADDRQSIPRHQYRYLNQKLFDYVIEKLKLGWSPEIISNRIKRDFIHAKKAMRVSSETIYQWIYKDAKKGG